MFMFTMKMICLKLTRLGVDTQLRIHPPEDATFLPQTPRTELLSRLREMKLGYTTQSEGYDIDATSSDIGSEVKSLLNLPDKRRY